MTSDDAGPAGAGSHDRTARGPTERMVAETPDAVAGLALVHERLAPRTQAERDAFWEAVRRCFAGGAPPPAPGA